MQIPENIKQKLGELPDKPGCYIMRDRRGKIIYVGKAISLRKRVQSYFREATFRSAPPKLRGLIKSVGELEWIVVRNEAEAILTEGRLIKDYKPRYNVSFKDDKRFPLLRVDTSGPFPRFGLCRIKRDDNALYFGPYASSPAARTTLDFIEKKFGLRKCSPVVPDASTYKHCIDDIVRHCSAPCIGKTGEGEYRERFEEACAFLRGERVKYLKELRGEMERLADAKDFERAAALRDTLFSLQATIRQNARVAATPEMKQEEAKKGVEELGNILGTEHEPRVMEAFDVSNISGTYSVASMVCSVDGMPHRNRYRRFRIRTVAGSDDTGMIAEAVRRRFIRLISERKNLPDLVLVDGGAGQLSAARTELAKLGLEKMPVAGLAKKFEELYWREKEPPIRLPEGSAALKVLQRLRDEAHRFALDYHHRLRGKRIRESVLDDIPGVGPKRKQELLKRFGSIRRVAKASEQEIAEVAGIGLAKTIKEALKGRMTADN